MTLVFLRVLSIFSLLALGVLLNKTKVLPIEGAKYFSAFILAVSSPCINFSSMLQMPYDVALIRPMAEVAIGVNLYFVLGFLVSYAIFKTKKNVSKRDIGILTVTMFSTNMAFLGFPITQSIFGDNYLFFMVVANSCSPHFYFVIIPKLLQMGSEVKTKLEAKSVLRSIFLNPPIIGALLGLLFFANSIPVPDTALDIIKMLSNTTTPLSMVVIGVQLGEVKIKELLSDLDLALCSLVKLMVLPLIVFIITYFLPLSVYAKVILTLGSCFPSASIASVYASTLNLNEKLTASGLVTTTLFSVVTIPIWCIVLNYVYF